MDDERKSPKAGERAAEGLRKATAKEEAKNESKMGHDLATFRRKIGWRWLLDRIDCFAENCKIGRIWVDVGRDH
jgi:hypothetical protein